VVVVAVKYAGRTLTIDFEGTPVANIRSVSEYGSSRNLIDASVYGEVWTDTVLGLQDGTVLTIQVALDPADAGADAIESFYTDNADDVAVWTFNHVGSGETVDVSTKITKVARESPLDGLYAMNVEAKIVNPGVVPGT